MSASQKCLFISISHYLTEETTGKLCLPTSGQMGQCPCNIRIIVVVRTEWSLHTRIAYEREA